MSLLRRLNVAAAWRADVQTARTELEATGAQAFVLAAHTFAWRLAAVALPVVVVVTAGYVLDGKATPSALLLTAGLSVFGPQMAVFLLTFPVAWFATLQTWFRGSRDARMRFGITGFVYPYYGWRYAYRGRRIPWGAMTRDEQVVSNPKRAGVRIAEGAGAHTRSQ